MNDLLHRVTRRVAWWFAAALLLPLARPCAQEAPPLHRVVTTTTDLAALARAVGGDRVVVTSLTHGPQDPHYIDPRPSMLHAVREAELLLLTGRQLESGWLPVLLQNGRNPAVTNGQLGYFDASRFVRAMGVPGAGVDRSAGDLHPSGNPHYLLDPLCGLQVAAQLRDRCAALWPADKAHFAAGFDALRRRLAVAMVGERLAALYDHDAELLAEAFADGKLVPLLQEQGDLDALGGWFGRMQPLRGSQVVVDHDLWPYFAQRFGLSVFGFVEPKPGVTPSTSHLEQLAQRMRDGEVKVVLSSPYFPVQYARTLEKSAGAVVAAMAHQPGARDGTDDYVAFVDHDVTAVAAALEKARQAGD
ncbi:MAG: zinc ABC transporter substrate-binding protein [Planctomycetes bacterium]|nr:zinc ABC transporter substrate-binding protein [Planctomycetota bacterium]